jgi:hypothetical protein
MNKTFFQYFTFWSILAGVMGLSELAQSQTSFRLNSGLKVTRINRPAEHERFAAAATAETVQFTEATLYPIPPLAGFSPLVAIAASNRRSDEEFNSEHRLESTYVGSPLIGSPAENYIIGVFDSGSMVDLVAGQSQDILGIIGPYLTDRTMPIGGVGGQIDAMISQPIGIFAAGLGAIDPNGTLDVSSLKGHSNTAILVSPEISCDTGESIIGAIGTPFVSFYTTVIENDNYKTVYHNGAYHSGPNVNILQQNSVSIPQYPRRFSMSLNTMAITASYFQFFDIDTFETTVETPTLLSLFAFSIPTGGVFMTTLYVTEGEPGPTNPPQEMYVMVDTGAQSSIITPAMAAKLSLPLTPDYTIDVCGVGGTVTDVPVYEIDYVKINALGGAMEFSNAPFVMLDLSLDDGQRLDGVLGMNFFWNRNVVFQPNLQGSSFFQVSDPVIFGNADFNHDGTVDLADFAIFAAAWKSQSSDPAFTPACDMYIDGQIDEKDFEAFLPHWLMER